MEGRGLVMGVELGSRSTLPQSPHKISYTKTCFLPFIRCQRMNIMNIRGNGRENDDIQTRHYSVTSWSLYHEITDNENKGYVVFKMKYISTDELGNTAVRGGWGGATMPATTLFYIQRLLDKYIKTT